MIKNYSLNGLLIALIFMFSIQSNAQQATPCVVETSSASTASSYGIYITSFATTGGSTNISNSTGFNSQSTSNDYRDTQIVTGEDGDVISYTITALGASPQVYAIYLDSNNDGTYALSEQLATGNLSSSVNGTGNFTVPGLADGNYNLRVVSDYTNSDTTYSTVTSGGCGNGGNGGLTVYGEAEDYTLKVGAPASCAAPTSFSNTSYGQTAASFSWTAGDSETEWEIEYGAIGFSSGSGTTVSSISSNSYTFNNLTAGTSYDFYVRAVCSANDKSDWSTAVSLSTLCASASSGFSNNFDSSSSLPNCYLAVNADGGTQAWKPFGVDGAGTNAAGIKYESSAHDDYLFTPPFTVSDGATDAFSMRVLSWDNYGTEMIDVLLYDASDRSLIATLSDDLTTNQQSSTGTFKSKYYDLSNYEGQDVMVAFHSTTNYLFYFFVDNVVVGSASEMEDGWAGYASSSWSDAENWYNGAVPTGDVVISETTDSAAHDPSIESALSLTSIEVESSASLTIAKNGSLTLSGNLTSSGTTTIQSDSNEFGVLIVQGSATGDITYNRWINSISTASPTENDTGWDLIGSPVVGAELTTSNFSQNGTSDAIMPYNNSDNTWTSTDAATFSTTSGQGYAMAKDAAAVESFTGTIQTDDVDVSITNNDGSGDGTQWNLVANPYPSYLNLNTGADATDNFVSQNQSFLGSGSNEDALWYWTGSGYGQYNNASAAAYIAPGQGFFVASATGGATLEFTEAMQTVTGSDDFISGDVMDDNRGELFISLGQNGLNRETEIYFIENTTDGSDPTYDARTFPMGDNNTSIYTRLVQDDEGVDLAIQSLAYSEIWDKVIPVGINALAEDELRISISHRTTPADLNIYLEDVLNGTMTNLLEEDFVLTPMSDLSGAGRFFIHMTADTMSNEDVSTSMLNAYKEVNANYITIEGLATQSNNINVSLYNILGSKVLDTSLSNNMNIQTISTVGMASGIYVIELESGNDRLSKKLIIQ